MTNSLPTPLKINDQTYVRQDTGAHSPPPSLEELRKDNPYFPWVLGNKYMIRTVTMHDHGTLVAVTDNELVLSVATWIADSGRWYDFIFKKNPANEVEAFPPDKLVIIGRGALIDAVELDVVLPAQK